MDHTDMKLPDEAWFDAHPLPKGGMTPAMISEMMGRWAVSEEGIKWYQESNPLSDEERKAEENFRALIERAVKPEDMVKLMRRHMVGIANIRFFLDRSLAMQDEMMPLVEKRLRTAKQDYFIENAAVLYLHCDKAWLQRLVDFYPEIWSPYAQSMLLDMVSFRAGEDFVPFMVREYERFAHLYPEESHADNVLRGIYRVCGKEL